VRGRVLGFVRQNAVALLALSVALGGTSYAATTKFVGKNGRVTACATTATGAIRLVTKGAKCRKGEQKVTWSQRGPAGARGPAGPAGLPGAPGPAGSIQGAAAGGDLAGQYPDPAIRAPEAVHLVGAPGEPAFQNGWAIFSSSNLGPVGFYKDREGFVHLTGDARHDTTSGCGTILFTLPAGYRPPTELGFPAVRQATSGSPFQEAHRINVGDDGIVFLTGSCENATATTILTLDGIVFRTE
jgi:hypothetical protein